MLVQVLGVLVLELFVITVNAKDVYVTSSSSSICKMYDLSSGEALNIHYSGATLFDECEITVGTYVSNYLCVEAVSFDIDSCDTTVKYYSGYSSYAPNLEETYRCFASPDKWCPGRKYIKITIDKTGSSGFSSTDVHLKVYQTDDDDFSDIGDVAKSIVATTYIIIGVVIGAIVLIGIIVTVIVCCVCNRRRATSGTVYNPQVPAGTYPTTAATPAAYPGAYPQTGYQPAVQAGYQPGYQPAPQAAGFQTAPNTDYKPASAPPSGMAMQPVQPPPYPGN